MFWKSSLEKPLCPINAVTGSIDRNSWCIEISLPEILLPHHRHYSKSSIGSKDLQWKTAFKIFTSSSILILWEPLKGGDTRSLHLLPICGEGGWKSSSLSVVSGKIRLFVCLITGGNCWPSDTDLDLSQSLFPLLASPETPHVVTHTQKVINNVLALNWFGSASPQMTAALIEEKAALGAG